MIVKNALSCSECFHEDDFYVFALGYEHRSFYLYDIVNKKYPSANTLVFVYDDYIKYDYVIERVKEAEKDTNHFLVSRYDQSSSVHEKFINVISDLIKTKDSIRIHIDYSSMPRSWYCKLPVLLQSIIRENDQVFFWYSEGEYPSSHEEYPSSGIDSFSCFSGKPSLQVDNNRIHIIALGYDTIRTQAILSITDPSYLVTCFAYDQNREDFFQSLKAANEPFLSRSAMSLALHLNDFNFMVSKICETANEYLNYGDIILIPDGPKPLIFAMSLVPDLLQKDGITCLHISRNSEHFEPVDVTATGTVHGFEISL